MCSPVPPGSPPVGVVVGPPVPRFPQPPLRLGDHRGGDLDEVSLSSSLSELDGAASFRSIQPWRRIGEGPHSHVRFGGLLEINSERHEAPDRRWRPSTRSSSVVRAWQGARAPT